MKQGEKHGNVGEQPSDVWRSGGAIACRPRRACARSARAENSGIIQSRWYDATVGRWLSQDPIAFGAGDANLYRYCGNDVASSADPTGLDTYWQNRELGGSTRKWNRNKLSHSYVFTTNPDGTLAHTYSWGNTANTRGWNKDQDEDIAAANEAIRDKATEHRGDAELDPFVEMAFWEMNQQEREHPWRPWNTCKTRGARSPEAPKEILDKYKAAKAAGNDTMADMLRRVD